MRFNELAGVPTDPQIMRTLCGPTTPEFEPVQEIHASPVIMAVVWERRPCIGGGETPIPLQATPLLPFRGDRLTGPAREIPVSVRRRGIHELGSPLRRPHAHRLGRRDLLLTACSIAFLCCRRMSDRSLFRVFAAAIAASITRSHAPGWKNMIFEKCGATHLAAPIFLSEQAAKEAASQAFSAIEEYAIDKREHDVIAEFHDGKRALFCDVSYVI